MGAPLWISFDLKPQWGPARDVSSTRRTLKGNDDDLLEVGNSGQHQPVVSLLAAIRAQTVHIYPLNNAPLSYR